MKQLKYILVLVVFTSVTAHAQKLAVATNDLSPLAVVNTFLTAIKEGKGNVAVPLVDSLVQ